MKNILYLLSMAVSQAAVVCSVDVPVVGPQQTATVSVFAEATERYAWTATGGSLSKSDQATVAWSPSGAAEGPYTISVSSASGSCSVVVFAGKEVRSAGGQGQPRKLRSATLLDGKTEEEHFGLYSYLVLGSKENDANRERYETFLKAFADKVASYLPLKDILPRQQYNIVYLPMLQYDERFIADHYDYHRAHTILERIPGTHTGDGPYIVSSNQPLGEGGPQVDRYLCQDLSTVPLPALKFWVDQFLAQTAQERWDQGSLRSVALRIRTGIEIASIAYPQVRDSIPKWFDMK